MRFSGSANSNMLSKISREPRELPWQPNLGKISQNYADYSSVQKNRVNFCMTSKVFGVGELKDGNKILRQQRELP